MNDSSYIKNLKALASLTPGEDDAKFAAASLEEFKKKSAAQTSSLHARPTRTRLLHYAAAITSLAAAIALGIFLFAKTNRSAEESLLAANEAQNQIAVAQPIIVSNSISATEYTTQAGEVKTITLEDGTKIWMNARTTIRVPNHFQKTLRKVELVEGEAFFDVAHDKNAPFIVSTYDMDIKVLGTEFNVFAYKGHDTKASLIKGSIKAYNPENEKAGKIIKPNESITATSEGLLEKTKISETELKEIDWKEGRYTFDNQSLKEIANKLELYYGTTITFADEDRANHEYSGKFRHGDGLEWILSAFQKADRFEYTYNRKTNTIIIN